ncbi:hypothetical protein BgiMline_025199 [Biomphalaria glabrata]
MAAHPSCALGGRVVCCGQSKGRRNKTCRTMSVDKKLRITDRGDRGRTMSTTWRHVLHARWVAESSAVDKAKEEKNKTCRTMSVDEKLRITDRRDRGRTMSTTWRHVFKRAGWQSRLLWTKQRKKKQNVSNDVRGQEVENH